MVEHTFHNRMVVSSILSLANCSTCLGGRFFGMRADGLPVPLPDSSSSSRSANFLAKRAFLLLLLALIVPVGAPLLR